MRGPKLAGEQEMASEQDFWRRSSKWEVNSYQEMILPIICAFVHRTAWTSRLRRFRSELWTWMQEVTESGNWFCESNDLCYFIQEKALVTGGYDEICDEFWRGFKGSKKNHANQFRLTHWSFSHTKYVI